MPPGAQEHRGNEFYGSSVSYRSYQETITSDSGLRCQRCKLVLCKQRPRAFAFLAHDGCPVFGRGIKGVSIHKLAIGIIEREVDRVGRFIERAVTDDLGCASTKDIEPM